MTAVSDRRWQLVASYIADLGQRTAIGQSAGTASEDAMMFDGYNPAGQETQRTSWNDAYA